MRCLGVHARCRHFGCGGSVANVSRSKLSTPTEPGLVVALLLLLLVRLLLLPLLLLLLLAHVLLFLLGHFGAEGCVGHPGVG